MTQTPITDDDRLTDEALHRAGVPPRFVYSDLKGFEARPGTEAAIAAARTFLDIDASVSGMILLGKPGSGKTHLAVGVLREVVKRNVARDPMFLSLLSRFVVVPELLDKLRERINDSSIPDPLPRLVEAPVLVLDDLGREKASEWVADRLYVLINARYNAERQTIVTSNSELSELAARGYEAMISRLRDGAAVVKITASDYRKAL